ncbi:tRNA-guanine transglycosylase DpdA [Thermopolyspora sp. NPDC052614]|uniref:tRNA-guanine transglycosylase DpdA n=1 Tax=Thermopolyspora sp. NPDC052614 TaxID=3155682 RepID=UPI0034276E12
MKFYFPDSQDQVSPTFNFITEEHSPYRVRQRDDKYAHEILEPLPYDGLLVSKAIVDGSVKGAGKYSMPQRERLYRLGVARYFRLPENILTLGDCGAFNYVDEELPPYTINEVLDFYERCGFNAGISIDHVIFGYDAKGSDADVNPAWKKRREISLRYAEDFYEAVVRRGNKIEPVGAAQGWSPASYADSVRRLQDIGYKRIALGGMVPLKTPDILACLKEIEQVRRPETELHLLGITRVASMEEFAVYGVTSFDSTSPFRQSFMDDRNNYHTESASYTAIRVPQVDGNPALKRRILAGTVSQAKAKSAERECMKRLRAYDAGAETVDRVIEILEEYEQLAEPEKKKSKISDYKVTLEAKPWKSCKCTICSTHGIEIVIFRGSERNKRRGFHNLSVFATKMHRIKRPLG